MSARDDATSTRGIGRTAGAPRAWQRVTATLIGCALLGAGLVGVLAARFAPDRQPRYEAEVRWQGGPPGPGEWPRPGRRGECAVPFDRQGRTLLAVRSFTARGTEGLAREMQRRRLSGVDASSARHAAARAQWRGAWAPGVPAVLPPAAQCAALVRARLLLFVLVEPRAPSAVPASSPASSATRTRLDRAEAEVVRLALAARPDSLAAALTACAAAEGEWLRALAGEPAPDPRARLEAAWRWHERSRAAVLDALERTLEAGLTKRQNAAVLTTAFGHALVLERLAPDPSAMLFVHGVWVPAPRAFPIVRTWVALLAAGALAGALAGLGLRLARRRSPFAGWLRPRAVLVGCGVPAALSPHASEGSRARLSRDARSAWETELGWLHVVSGPDPAQIARAAATLAGGFLARGERVLLLDAGRRLRLHERFGGDTRWGLGECLAGEVPLLGAVQSAGHPGFYFLGHGAPAGAKRWDELSRLLEEARPHFGRVLLALDPRSSREAALPLGGRVLEAWWAEPGPGLPRAAVALSERLGIPFSCLELNWLTQAMLEVDRTPSVAAPGDPPPTEVVPDSGWRSALAGAEAPATWEDASVASAILEAEHAPVPVDAPEVTARVSACPVVLGCDPEVRERLRFMIWMRRIQAQGRAPALETGAGR